MLLKFENWSIWSLLDVYNKINFLIWIHQNGELGHADCRNFSAFFVFFHMRQNEHKCRQLLDSSDFKIQFFAFHFDFKFWYQIWCIRLKQHQEAVCTQATALENVFEFRKSKQFNLVRAKLKKDKKPVGRSVGRDGRCMKVQIWASLASLRLQQ